MKSSRKKNGAKYRNPQSGYGKAMQEELERQAKIAVDLDNDREWRRLQREFPVDGEPMP